ncbi:MAG: hypothetical protein J3Q66DRAFT_327685 [Benniella sp.]|nr:MAG: hypothetical protein J3Q66DRAFT_327685 [Benniella sp.]
MSQSGISFALVLSSHSFLFLTSPHFPPPPSDYRLNRQPPTSNTAMADEKPAYDHPVYQSRQPVVAFDISKGPALQESGSAADAAASTSPPDASKQAYAKKTGTRSTFCPNTLRKGTKLTEDDYEHHENAESAQPTGWLQMLGLKKSPNYGDRIDNSSDPHHQSYY